MRNDGLIAVGTALVAVAAAHTAAALTATGRTGPSRGSVNRAVTPRESLWVGTTRKNLPGILEQGLIPSGGSSVHRTKTRSAVFLAGDATAALLYADAAANHRARATDPDDPVLIEVEPRGLRLLPDYDDVDIGPFLDELSDRVGAEIVPGEPLGELESEVQDALWGMEDDPDGWGVKAEVEDEGDERVLAIVPLHRISVNRDAYGADSEIYEDLTVDGDGTPVWETTQYQHQGPIPLDRIRAIYVLARGGRSADLSLTSYGHLSFPSKFYDAGEAIDAGATISFRTRRFHRLTPAEARRRLRSGGASPR